MVATMLVIHDRSATEVKKAATAMLMNELESYSGSILLLLSGGSSLTLLEGEMSTTQTNHITIGMIDERVTRDATINNFTLAYNQPLVRSILMHGGSAIISPPRLRQSLENFALEYETRLDEWLSRNPKGKIIATMGIGTDGHIAAIFPEQSDTFRPKYLQTERLVHYYDIADRPVYPRRLTVTGKLLQKIDCAILFATGESKRSIIEKVLKHQTFTPSLPGTFVHIMPMVHVFTDVF